MIVILGPTGTGKSHLALQLHQDFDCEIVNADSRQVYRFMDIGTAKPTIAERAAVPHHLYDIVNPDEDFGLAQYQQLAYQTIGDIHKRGKLPILVGGSGQYIWAVIEGWQIPQVQPNLELRSRLQKIALEQGSEVLFKQLQELDPQSAYQIDPRNIRRVVRAIEVSLLTGQQFSKLKQKVDPGFSSLVIGLTTNREDLYRLVDTRVDEMMGKGFETETRYLLERGYDFENPALNSIGYTHMGMYIRGEISLNDAVALIKNDNHRFIRHQYAWFKLKDNRIHWIDIKAEIYSKAFDLVKNWIS